MCKACKMDPKDERVREFRMGAVEPEDFEIEFNYQTRTKGKSGRRWRTSGNAKTKTRPGCPENEFKAHIYVWTTEYEDDNFFSDYYGFHKNQTQICCGCGKGNKVKRSDEYEKIKARKFRKLFGDGTQVPRGEPIGHWVNSLPHGYTRIPSYNYWSWESYDKDYMAARRDYMARHGFPKYLWGSLYY